MRGQRVFFTSSRRVLRIIPARAGPTMSAHTFCLSYSDHPRSCGANGHIEAAAQPGRGSSPLVRGQLVQGGELGETIRIIPARAGPTFASPNTVSIIADHPRSCGANMWCAVFGIRSIGSSPLVRGQLAACRANHRTRRIIPARAGPTMRPTCWRASGSDHPRSCGANSTRSWRLALQCGSSPLVRGQQPHA